MDRLTESQALKKLQNGSQEALAWLIRRYTPYVTVVVRNIIGGSMAEEDVEETAADVFFTLWNQAEAVMPGALRPYLGGVARNKALQRLRDAGKTVPLEEDFLELPTENPQREIEREELNAAVREAVLSMALPDREIFLRHYFHFQTVEKIAGEMDIPASTVKSRLRRGREKLKETLTKNLTEYWR